MKKIAKKTIIAAFVLLFCGVYSSAVIAQITAFPHTEDFSDDVLPTNWATEIVVGTGTVAWVFDNTLPAGKMVSPTSDNGYASFYAPLLGTDVTQATLTSPTFDFTGKTSVVLDFYHVLIWNNTDGYVEYSIDGGVNWTLGASFEDRVDPAEKVLLDLTAELAGESNVKLRWRGLKTTTNNYWECWSVDDVTVNASAFDLDFSVDVTLGSAPLDVAFTCGTLPAGTYSYAWVFGDGEISSDENPDHTYTTTGVYTVKLTVTNTVSLENSVVEKDNYITVVPFSGEGTEVSPFLIGTLSDLDALSGLTLLWDKYFKLTANIDAAGTETDPLYNNGGEGFSPIGTSSVPFNGFFNGDSFEISDLYINKSLSGKGLFGYTANANISNLGVVDAELLGAGQYHGILIGSDEGSSASLHSTIENCYTTGTVNGGIRRIGGFIGNASRTECKGCYCDVSVSGDENGSAFVGYSYYGEFTNCYAQGDVYMSKDGQANVGGFVGASYGDKTTNCYSTAEVTSFAGATNVGGFIGYATYSPVYKGSYWDTETSGQATSGGTTGNYYKGLTTAEFAVQANFMEDASTSWDFTATTGIWKMGKIVSDPVERPRLMWQELDDNVPVTTTWIGTNSSDCSDAGNWSDGVPGATTAVTIPVVATNYPTLTFAATVASLDLAEGATIVGAENLTVTGDFSTKRHVTWYDEYHYLSSPVGEIALENTFPNGSVGAAFYMYSYEESSQTWAAMEREDEMEAGIGYNVYRDAGAGFDFDIDFTNAAPTWENAIFTNLSITGAVVDYSGWHLLGNPFPAAIDWDLGTWNKSNIDGSVYTWDGINGQHVSWNGTAGELTNGVLPVGQGFMVKANDVTNSITIPTDAAVHSSALIYKSESSALRLQVTTEATTYSDATFVTFNTNATTEFDNEYDAYKLAGLEEAPQLYTQNAETKYSINVVPESTEMIVMNFEAGIDGTYTINASDLSLNATVTLEDLQTGTTQVLNENATYTFEATTSDDAERFVIHLKAGNAVNELDETAYSIYAFNNTLYVDAAEAGLVNVYNTIGQVVNSTNATTGLNSISLEGGIYIVNINGVSQKVIVK